MDTSEEYIVMRIAAIGNLGKGECPKEKATLHTYHGMYSVCVDVWGTFFVQDNADTDDYICILERQDQLQEIILELPRYHYDNRIGSLCYGFELWRQHINKLGIAATMEQYWLAFVMNRKYGKSWNGEEWREDDNRFSTN